MTVVFPEGVARDDATEPLEIMGVGEVRPIVANPTQALVRLRLNRQPTDHETHLDGQLDSHLGLKPRMWLELPIEPGTLGATIERLNRQLVRVSSLARERRAVAEAAVDDILGEALQLNLR